ncbi:MAG: helix-turn-helix transcriptional regulator [Clostridia bacterium]|nr:helix-turn-helix transcriptional regulator [Clostridia bacterium]
MNHVPIVKPINEDCILEFSHFNKNARAGAWKKENVIMRNCIKINVFIEGNFSIFSDGVLHHPTYGDICVLPPMRMHYGQITESMHINYYQLDIGRKVFSTLPDGERMIDRLLQAMEKNDSFLRPDAKSRDVVLKLFGEIESALVKEEPFLAYAKVVEFLAMLPSLYLQPTKGMKVYSLRTAQAIKYIETNYAEHISVKQISNELGVSASFLSRIFKKEIGGTIHEYLNQYRIAKAISLLKTHSVTEVAYACGFCDTSHFISIFKKYTGNTPMQYKKQQY